MTTPNTYLRTRVMTASPAELRLMLFDGAIRFLKQGLEGLDSGDHEAAYDGYSQCEAIIVELISALDPDKAPDLCQKLSSLYTFMYLQLVESLSEKDPEKGRSVLKLLEYERETWVQLMEKLASEGIEVKDATAAASAAAANSSAAAAAPPVNGIGDMPDPGSIPAPPYGKTAGGGGSLNVAG